MLTSEALRERAVKLGLDLARYPTAQWTERILATFTALVAEALEPWEARAASLADCLNQELRENGPIDVLQVAPEEDLRPALQLLVDLVRQYGERRVAETRREQIEIAAFLLEPMIYDLAQKMAERGLFVRDDFGEPSIHAVRELVAGIAAALRAQEAP